MDYYIHFSEIFDFEDIVVKKKNPSFLFSIVTCIIVKDIIILRK